MIRLEVSQTRGFHFGSSGFWTIVDAAFSTAIVIQKAQYEIQRTSLNSLGERISNQVVAKLHRKFAVSTGSDDHVLFAVW